MYACIATTLTCNSCTRGLWKPVCAGLLERIIANTSLAFRLCTFITVYSQSLNA